MKLIQVGSDVIDQVAGNLAVQLVAIHQPSRDVARFQRIDIDYREQLCPGFDGFWLMGLEFRESHGLALRTDATSVVAKRRASRSTAGVSSGTKSLEFCASSKTSRNVHRSFWNRTLPVEESVRRTLISTRRL